MKLSALCAFRLVMGGGVNAPCRCAPSLLRRIGMAFLFVAALSFEATAETVYFYWTGGNGDWTDPSHWVDASGNPRDGYPQTTNHVVIFKAGVSASVNLSLPLSADKVIVEETAAITLGGGGTVTTSAVYGYDQSGANRINGDLTLNDVTWRIPRSRLYVSGLLKLKDGASVQQDTIHTEIIDRPSADIILDGGSLSVPTLYINSPNPGAVMHVRRGVLAAANAIIIGGGGSASTYSGNRLEISGGSVSCETLSCDPDVSLLLDGGELRVNAVVKRGAADLAVRSGRLISSDGAVREEFEIIGAGCVFCLCRKDAWFAPNANGQSSTTLAETLLATNNGTVTLRGHWSGRGSIIANRIWTDASYGYIDCRNLVLGSKALHDGTADIHIYNDITLGAFGDWATEVSVGGNTPFYRCHGDVTVDTLDWFDRTTPRTIKLLFAWPDDGVRMEVRGGGSFVYGSATRKWNYDYAPLHVLREVDVKAGTTLELYRNAILATDRLRLAAGATLRLRAGTSSLQAGSVEIDPTAKLEILVEAGAIGGNNAPLLVGGFDSIDLSRITPVGESLAPFELRKAAGTIFLDNGVQPALPETASNAPAVWTGAIDGDWNNPGNWFMASETSPWSWMYVNTGHYPEFRGTRNTEVRFTADLEASDLCILFGLEAGPFSLDADRSDFVFRSWGNNYYASLPNATVGSKSSYPGVLFKTVSNFAGCCSLFADSPAYIEANAGVVTPRMDASDSSPGHFYVYGDVRVGGTSACNSLTLQKQMVLTTHPRQKATRLTVRTGGTLTVNANGGTMSDNSTLAVQWGATVTFARDANGAALYDFTGAEQNNTVDGTLNVRCPFRSTGVVRFYGDGTVYLSGARHPGTAGRAPVALGCGVSFCSDGWISAAGNADYAAPIVATNGLAYLTAPHPWTYGVASDYAGPVTAADRALHVGLGGHLVIASTNGCAISFSDAIVGPGTLEFADGAVIGLVGAKAADLAAGRWVELTRTGSLVGMPTLAGVGTCKFREETNGDGTVSLYARIAPGTMILLR